MGITGGLIAIAVAIALTLALKARGLEEKAFARIGCPRRCDHGHHVAVYRRAGCGDPNWS